MAETTLRQELEAAWHRVDEQLEADKKRGAHLKARHLDIVGAQERGETDQAKELMAAALDYEYEWLGSCEITAPLSEYLGYDQEE